MWLAVVGSSGLSVSSSARSTILLLGPAIGRELKTDSQRASSDDQLRWKEVKLTCNRLAQSRVDWEVQPNIIDGPWGPDASDILGVPVEECASIRNLLSQIGPGSIAHYHTESCDDINLSPLGSRGRRGSPT